MRKKHDHEEEDRTANLERDLIITFEAACLPPSTLSEIQLSVSLPSSDHKEVPSVRLATVGPLDDLVFRA